ncbi:uncharacterized protein LOC124359357 [Homalodisca vitripennis]|uniref:uncharacterized protein LOC124359357 n=1 Tax=Homalodisca vitripennis TaxID=197043 RepID=UPI001EEB410C|nr:uncharacterized protein LOC124359357 [Homalodisca vitripennis]KAG8301360.1 hypothetical protein J6590_055128 [Homalodisca vitripennis]
MRYSYLLLFTLCALFLFSSVMAGINSSPESPESGPISSEERNCFPGSTWTRNCQSCVCSPQGVPTCTGVPCL